MRAPSRRSLVCLLALLGACHPPRAGGDDPARFYAHHTRTAAPDRPGTLSGANADVVVNLGRDRQLVFARDQSHRPVWQVGRDRHPVPHLVAISGDGPAEGRFDRSNQYAWARIVESGPEAVVVDWRYRPDLDDLSPTGLVHERYTIRPDGHMTREHRAGTVRPEDWDDPAARTVQTFQLSETGLTLLETRAATPPGPLPPAAGAPLLPPAVPVAPVAHWALDEATGDEASGGPGHQGTVGAPLWTRGVSGTALGLDGQEGGVVVDAPPPLSGSVTAAAWVALGAFPWSRAPLVQRATGAGAAGWYLGIDAHGHPLLTVDGTTLRAPAPLERRRWAQVVGVAGPAGLALYVDGERVATRDRPARVRSVEAPLSLGRNTVPLAATDGVRDEEVDAAHHFSSVFGIEGLLDEVMLFDTALDDDAVAALFESQAPAVADDALPPRRLPALDTAAHGFGAVATRLAFHPLWDRRWRATEGDDLVVHFDHAPVAFAYWRGTTHGLNAVTEGRWMSDQSVEVLAGENDADTVSLAEHMSDKTALRSHVRVLENTPARVVVQWRYALSDVLGTLAGDQAFVDETHTIYPDGVAVRAVHTYLYDDPEDTVEFYQDFQWLLAPDDDPAAFLDREAVALADLSGPTQTVHYPYEDDDEESIPGSIALLRSHTEWKVFGIAQGSGFSPGQAAHERSPHIDWAGAPFPFPGPWNHWPVAQIPSDGRFATALDRVAHVAVGGLAPSEHGTGAMLVGFTQGTVAELVPLARAWRRPPAVEDLVGLAGGTHDIDQRAFVFRRRGATRMGFTLAADPQHPVVNPCFVIQGWNSDAEATVAVDGVPVAALRQGVVVDAAGDRMLVLTLPLSATAPLAVTVAPR